MVMPVLMTSTERRSALASVVDSWSAWSLQRCTWAALSFHRRLQLRGSCLVILQGRQPAHHVGSL